jgi:hypothetical protein
VFWLAIRSSAHLFEHAAEVIHHADGQLVRYVLQRVDQAAHKLQLVTQQPRHRELLPLGDCMALVIPTHVTMNTITPL